MPGGFLFAGYGGDAPPQNPEEPGIVAVSATNLQGIYLDPKERAQYAALRSRRPIASLGGSIYLYNFPLDPPAGPAGE